MKHYKLNEIENKRILGRNICGVEKKEEINLFWAASGLEINVMASEVWAEFSADYNGSEPWVSVFLNGSRISRFMVEKNPKNVCLVRGLDSTRENVITIYKDTQPMTGDSRHSLKICGVSLDDGGKFCELKPKSMKIEFIGDSITSGEGLAGSPSQMEWIPCLFVGSDSYAAQIARNMNADFSVFSECGWGLCWGWDGNCHNKMPDFYEEVCSVMAMPSEMNCESCTNDFQKELGCLEKYDFKGGSDFVVLNLGTNDNGAFFQPPWKDENGSEHKLTLENGKIGKKDWDILVEGAKNFLKTIRKNNPHAQIIWSYGMIKLDLFPDCLKTAVDEYICETGDKKVHVVELESMEDVEKYEFEKGSRGHPGKKVHALAAEKLEKLIRSL